MWHKLQDGPILHATGCLLTFSSRHAVLDGDCTPCLLHANRNCAGQAALIETRASDVGLLIAFDDHLLALQLPLAESFV
jgi:hypothetical protein